MSNAIHTHAPDINHLSTEDDEPVDNIYASKQQRLLTDSLYSSWPGPGPGRKFLADSNVGTFYLARNPGMDSSRCWWGTYQASHSARRAVSSSVISTM